MTDNAEWCMMNLHWNGTWNVDMLSRFDERPESAPVECVMSKVECIEYVEWALRFLVYTGFVYGIEPTSGICVWIDWQRCPIFNTAFVVSTVYWMRIEWILALNICKYIHWPILEMCCCCLKPDMRGFNIISVVFYKLGVDFWNGFSDAHLYGLCL